jgi:hypothetical protein
MWKIPVLMMAISQKILQVQQSRWT